MKTSYEGLFIFPETLEDAQLDQAIDAVKTEIEKLGGTLDSSTKLGKRSFSRPLRKKKAGNYVVIMLSMDGVQLDALKRRLKLATNVFRSQFMVKNESSVVQEA